MKELVCFEMLKATNSKISREWKTCIMVTKDIKILMIDNNL
jgi:hypothetical protein